MDNIELRWLDRNAYKMSADGRLIPYKEKVLQYRKLYDNTVYAHDASGAITQVNKKLVWSEWMDVPTVVEGSNDL